MTLYSDIEFEITSREVIFSLFLIGIMTVVGFLISNKIEQHVNDSITKYRESAQISTSNEFQHAVRTDIGNAFVHGYFETVDTVKHQKLKGDWLYLYARYQEYRMHTEYYTTTDSKGRVHHHIRHYWSWDTYDTEERHAKHVIFSGKKFSYGTFSYSYIRYSEYVIDNGYHKRIVFYVRPKEFFCTFYGNLSKNTVNGTPALTHMSIKEYYEDCTTSHIYCIFWVLWIILTIIVMVIFYRIDNEWLEN